MLSTPLPTTNPPLLLRCSCRPASVTCSTTWAWSRSRSAPSSVPTRCACKRVRIDGRRDGYGPVPPPSAPLPTRGHPPSPLSISGADPGGARRLQPAARLPRLRRDAQWRRVPLSHVLRQRHRHEEQLLQLRAGPRRLLPHHQPLHHMARHRRRPPHPQPLHMRPRLSTRQPHPARRPSHAHATRADACACIHRHRPMHVTMQAARP